MASPNHTLPSPDISDVMNLLSTMKKQNEEILVKNEEILTKLNSIEDDNRKLRQELHEIKKYHQRHNSVKNSSNKRNEPEDQAEEYQNEPSNSNKKARVSVSVASLPEPELVHALEPTASFDTLDDDCLGNVLDFVGKSCYSAFGRVNKRCHEMFCSKGLPKETYLYGYGPLHLIKQRWIYCDGSDIAKGVLHYNRRDVLDWMLRDESDESNWDLNHLCYDAIVETSERLDILREVFQRANEQQLKCLRDCDNDFDLCFRAAYCGKLEYLKFLRENGCEWGKATWYWAKKKGHDHILEYMRDNGYPAEWQYDSDSDSDSDSD